MAFKIVTQVFICHAVCFLFFFVGVDDVDYGRYPDESLQKKWLRMYLEEAAKLKGGH